MCPLLLILNDNMIIVPTFLLLKNGEIATTGGRETWFLDSNDFFNNKKHDL